MSSVTAWSPPPADLCLRDGDLHLWLIPIGLAPSQLDALAAALTPDEVDRAARFHFERDRARFVAARGSLRRILARYTRLPPEALRFDYSPHGKPSLAAALEVSPSPAFNLSHSGDWALAAFRPPDGSASTSS